MSMSIEEAIRILNPETSADAIAEIEYYAGFNRNRAIEKVEEACIIACDIMREHLEDTETVFSDKVSYENLNQMSKERLVGLFLKIKKLFNKTCERCDKLEKENEELSDLDKDLDKMINSLPDDNNLNQREKIIDEVSNILIDYFSEHAHEVWDRVSARDFICDNIEMIAEKLKSECL